MSPLRSAVSVLRRPTPQGWAFLRRSVASGGAPTVGDRKAGCMCMGAELEELAVNVRQLRENVAIIQEHKERFQRREQFQKKLSYVLVPGAIAFYIFGPDKKREPSPEGQSSA